MTIEDRRKQDLRVEKGLGLSCDFCGTYNVSVVERFMRGAAICLECVNYAQILLYAINDISLKNNNTGDV